MDRRLKSRELKFLSDADFFPIDLKDKLVAAISSQGSGPIGGLVQDEIDLLREMLLDRQTFAGFDEEYALNDEGALIQDIVDKLPLR